MAKLRVGVIYGGRSGEHEVSLASGASILKHLDRDKYDVVAVRIEKDGRWTLPERAPTAISAAEVIEALRPFGAMGYTDVIVRHLVDDQPKVLGSMARLAEVRQALAG